MVITKARHDAELLARFAIWRAPFVSGPHAFSAICAGAAARSSRNRGTASEANAPSDEGWFEAEAPCGTGAHYLYVLDDGSRVPDPASRGQVPDVHGWSVVVDPADYLWKIPEWRGRTWQETIIYELHCGLYGGFRGVVAALPRLADLGVTAVELMPINDFSGTRNWGYDGVLPFAPDSAYGSPNELKALVDAAHAHGLMIFLDVVYNHFGPDGNYLGRYAPTTFRDDFHTPLGRSN